MTISDKMDTKKQSNFRKIKVSDYTLGASVLQGYMRFMISFPGEESCTLRLFEGKEEKQRQSILHVLQTW